MSRDIKENNYYCFLRLTITNINLKIWQKVVLGGGGFLYSPCKAFVLWIGKHYTIHSNTQTHRLVEVPNGVIQQCDAPTNCLCLLSREKIEIYELICNCSVLQGMRCPANTHKPSFHVNASLLKQNSGKGSTSAQRGGGIPNGVNMDGGIDEEEFFEWLQNAVQSGMFESFGAQNEPPSPGSGSNAKGSNSSSKKKKKGKKQW